jgi:transposase-like protein
VLEGAADDVLTHMAFPSAHWSRIDSTNPLERLNREVRRRTDVVGVFPNTDSVIRLLGSVLREIDDE